mmetsp:Transcript_14650/g.37254  ORF Transcript_14650/g.37254 Transcript_14650/m.37254 type:complete len:108 (-) Transcript_14650:24-347(-)
MAPRRTTRLALLAAALVQACAVDVQGMKKTDVKGCQTICQRFGMKALAKEFRKGGKEQIANEFENSGNPTACCKVCEEAYSGTSSDAAAPVKDGAAAPAAASFLAKA